MAIVEFVNKPNKTYPGMRKVIDYVLNPKKTNDRLITGIGLNAANAFNEMVTLKRVMGKTDKCLWYHFIQSFVPYDNVTPELAQKVALETAAYFKDQYQILIVTHIDKDHIHTHFILNTVNIETGRKYTQNNAQRLEIQDFSDRVCEKYGLHTLSNKQKNNRRYKKPGEYRIGQSSKSWKTELKNTIDGVLSTSTGKADFIAKMEARGYQVKWTDTRENITFTTPTGMKCRDKRLGEPEYYNKHNFELIFEHNALFAEKEEAPITDAIQGIADLSGMFSDSNYQVVTDGFMLQDVDFDSMTWQEIKQTIERLRFEAEIRKVRALANQNEQERKAAQQALRQRMALLDELGNWLYEQKFGQVNNYAHNYDNEDDCEI